MGLALNNLGYILTVAGEHARAEGLLLRALGILELEPSHVELDAALEGYAGLLEELGRHREAARLRARIGAASGEGTHAGRPTPP